MAKFVHRVTMLTLSRGKKGPTDLLYKSWVILRGKVMLGRFVTACQVGEYLAVYIFLVP